MSLLAGITVRASFEASSYSKLYLNIDFVLLQFIQVDHEINKLYLSNYRAIRKACF